MFDFDEWQMNANGESKHTNKTMQIVDIFVDDFVQCGQISIWIL